MLLAYLDESYTRDHYYIAALVVQEQAVVPLTEALDAVVEKAADNYRGIRPRAELHGHELFHGASDWAALEGMARARIGVYNDAFQAIADVGACVILRGVHSRGLRERYQNPEPPHGVVLAHLLERIDTYAKRRAERALVIADEVDGQQSYRRDLRHFQRFGTWGYRAKQLTCIIDTMHFVPSEASRLVQAADMIAFMHRRRLTHTETDDRAVRANAALWDRIEACVEHSHTWYP